MSVGNLPPQSTVLIKITYVTELPIEDARVCFRLPGSVAPWKRSAALDDVTQTTLDTTKIETIDRDVSIHVAVDMPFDIRQVLRVYTHVYFKISFAVCRFVSNVMCTHALLSKLLSGQ